MVSLSALVCSALAVAGCFYTLAAAAAVRRFGRSEGVGMNGSSAVTLLKPLHGAEPELYANLRSFCEQSYTGEVQIIFGTQNPTDPAIPVARRLVDEFPSLDIGIVVNPRALGANRKISNLAAMRSAVRHEIVVISDSDIRVGANYLGIVVHTLAQSGTGAVTCLYRGRAGSNRWSRLAAMAIDYNFIPSVLVGLALGLARPCFGSTIAMTLQTLDDIGGFEAYVDYLADDHAMGEAVRARGMQVAIAPTVVDHSCSESSLRDVFGHELRWARTIRALDPLGYAGSVVTHGVPFAIAAAAMRHFDTAGVALLVATIACRVVLMIQVDHTFQSRSRRLCLAPVRDVLSFAIFMASFFVGVVSWRGQRYRVRSDGTIVEVKGSKL